jgi:hypothetical protein
MNFSGTGNNKSTIAWNQAAHTLTILLGGKSGPGTQGTVASTIATYTPDPAITSAVGTPITGTTSTPTGRQF